MRLSSPHRASLLSRSSHNARAICADYEVFLEACGVHGPSILLVFRKSIKEKTKDTSPSGATFRVSMEIFPCYFIASLTFRLIMDIAFDL